MNGGFLDIATPQELAGYFGLTYAQLAETIYRTDEVRRYAVFRVPKKGGGDRVIHSPCVPLKTLQRKLKDELYAIYHPRPSVHGFVRERSIVTNALVHTQRAKTYVFNIDLRGYFDSIHFGRVKGLFKARPFEFDDRVATVLAQICCFQNALPQGAPTSPIVANMVTRKLDRQLQILARGCNATYSRYADDITFSFTCSRRRLPRNIVEVENESVAPGGELTRLIEDNGFRINYEKVRLASGRQHMEVTGLTVNERPNVARRYVRQVSAMLHAWEKYGLEPAEAEFNQKYDTRHRPSGRPKCLSAVVRGKLAYLRSVRGADDLVYAKLAARYNALVSEPALRLPVPPPREASPVLPEGEFHPTAFVSYAHEDTDFVRQLDLELRRRGVQVWIDETESASGETLPSRIGDAIAGSEFVVAVVSADSASSPWCRDELSLAKAHRVKSGRPVILPVRLGAAEIPSFLADLVWVDGEGAKNTPRGHATMLFAAMQRHARR